jgi:predicted nucleic acid-binding protein
LLAAKEKFAIGVGELSTIFLAKEIRADYVLLDDLAARRLGKMEGLKVLGTAGLLEAFYLGGYLADLRTSFGHLLAHSYLDRRLLNRRLQDLGLPPL